MCIPVTLKFNQLLRLKLISAFRAWAHRSFVCNLYSLPSFTKCVPHCLNSKDTFFLIHGAIFAHSPTSELADSFRLIMKGFNNEQFYDTKRNRKRLQSSRSQQPCSSASKNRLFPSFWRGLRRFFFIIRSYSSEHQSTLFTTPEKRTAP